MSKNSKLADARIETIAHVALVNAVWAEVKTAKEAFAARVKLVAEAKKLGRKQVERAMLEVKMAKFAHCLATKAVEGMAKPTLDVLQKAQLLWEGAKSSKDKRVADAYQATSMWLSRLRSDAGIPTKGKGGKPKGKGKGGKPADKPSAEAANGPADAPKNEAKPIVDVVAQVGQWTAAAKVESPADVRKVLMGNMMTGMLFSEKHSRTVPKPVREALANYKAAIDAWKIDG